mgnify:CR=1 FL=1
MNRIIIVIIFVGLFFTEIVSAQIKSDSKIILNKDYTDKEYIELKTKVASNFSKAFVLKTDTISMEQLQEWLEVANLEIKSCKFKNTVISPSKYMAFLKRINDIIILGCEK